MSRQRTIPPEGPQDGIEVTIPPPAASLAVQWYLALDRLEGRAEPGEMVELDEATAAIYLALGLVAPADASVPGVPVLVSVEDAE